MGHYPYHSNGAEYEARAEHNSEVDRSRLEKLRHDYASWGLCQVVAIK